MPLATATTPQQASVKHSSVLVQNSPTQFARLVASSDQHPPAMSDSPLPPVAVAVAVEPSLKDEGGAKDHPSISRHHFTSCEAPAAAAEACQNSRDCHEATVSAASNSVSPVSLPSEAPTASMSISHRTSSTSSSGGNGSSSATSSADSSPAVAYRNLHISLKPKQPTDQAAGSAVSAQADSEADKKDTEMADAEASTKTSAAGDKPASADADEDTSNQPRYKPIRTLQHSLFGQVQLAFDNVRQLSVAVKVSHAHLVTPVALQGSKGDMAAATARSQAGVSVLEDVRREARIMTLLMGDGVPPLSTRTIHEASTGISRAMVEAINLPKNCVLPENAPADATTVQQQFIASINKGKRCIATFYEEVQTENFHYLISQFCENGDLFSVLTAQPQHKVSESVARAWMYQLCCSVRYLHAHSVAHLDLSLENACLDGKGSAMVIDFGLASQHPLYDGDRASKEADGTRLRNTSAHIRLVSESERSKPADGAQRCTCSACTRTSASLLAQDPSIQAAGGPTSASFNRLKFLCRPICTQVHKPGKLGYMSPELYRNHCWDAYGQDIFSLGVLLYSMVTGRPPFTRPDEDQDVWFKVIHSGQWLTPQVRQQGPAQIYTDLSHNVLDLIDRMIKPQHMRPTIDQVLRHPFFQEAHPHNKPASSGKNGKAAGKIKRSGSE